MFGTKTLQRAGKWYDADFFLINDELSCLSSRNFENLTNRGAVERCVFIDQIK